jgi:hypothetical protein
MLLLIIRFYGLGFGSNNLISKFYEFKSAVDWPSFIKSLFNKRW